MHFADFKCSYKAKGVYGLKPVQTTEDLWILVLFYRL